MDKVVNYTIGLVIILTWLLGIVIAKGIYETILACLFAPYAWYLVAERLIL